MKAVKICAGFFAIQVLLASCSNAEERTVTLDRADTLARPAPMVVGIGVHFGIDGQPTFNYVADKAIRAMDELGVDSYRDDLVWGLFDPDGDGKGNAQPARLFDFMRKARQTPLLVMGYANPSVPDSNPPLTDKSRERFASFIAEAVRATSSFKPIYEIWNEWNVNAKPGVLEPLRKVGTPDEPRAAVNYAALARAALPAARRAGPDATVLAGGVGEDMQWDWTKAIVDDGATRDASALSVHLYNHCNPGPNTNRTATELVDRLDVLQTMLGGKSKPVPLFITELGWPTTEIKGCDISRQTAADNIAQFLLWSAATPWVKGVWLYQLKDQGTQKDQLEENFGLYDYDYKPKPAACAAREAVQLIKTSAGFTLSRPFPHVYVMRAETGDGPRLIAWTTATAAKAHVIVKGATVRHARRLCGEDLKTEGGGLDVGSTPVVLSLDDALKLTLDVSQQ